MYLSASLKQNANVSDVFLLDYSIASRKLHHDFREGKCNLDKYMSGMKLFKLTGLPFYLVVKFSDGLYYCEVSLLSYAQLTISFGGRTDRADAQDVEPCVFFDTNLFKKVVSKE